MRARILRLQYREPDRSRLGKSRDWLAFQLMRLSVFCVATPHYRDIVAATFLFGRPLADRDYVNERIEAIEAHERTQNSQGCRNNYGEV